MLSLYRSTDTLGTERKASSPGARKNLGYRLEKPHLRVSISDIGSQLAGEILISKPYVHDKWAKRILNQENIHDSGLLFLMPESAYRF